MSAETLLCNPVLGHGWDGMFKDSARFRVVFDSLSCRYRVVVVSLSVLIVRRHGKSPLNGGYNGHQDGRHPPTP